MQKTIKVFLAIIITLSVVSCTKESKETEDSSQSLNLYRSAISIINEHFSNATEVDGRIFIVNDFKQTKYGESSSSFSFQGTFPEGTEYSNFSINDYNTDICENKFFATSSFEEDNLKGRQGDYFGQNCSFMVDGEPLCEDLYIPKQAIVSFPNNSGFIFEKSSGITFELEVDNQNDKPIVVVLQYVSDNLEAGETPVTKSFILESNTNWYNIPSDDLVDFPENEKLIFYVGWW